MVDSGMAPRAPRQKEGADVRTRGQAVGIGQWRRHKRGVVAAIRRRRRSRQVKNPANGTTNVSARGITRRVRGGGWLQRPEEIPCTSIGPATMVVAGGRTGREVAPGGGLSLTDGSPTDSTQITGLKPAPQGLA